MNYNAIKLTAPIKDYLWGGTRLKTDFGKITDKEKASRKKYIIYTLAHILMAWFTWFWFNALMSV